MIAAVMTLGVIAPNFSAMPEADANNQERQAMVHRGGTALPSGDVLLDAPVSPTGVPPNGPAKPRVEPVRLTSRTVKRL